MRDLKGRFKKGRFVSDLERKRNSDFMKKENRNRSSYLGELRNHQLYNIWRSIKGKNDSRGGCPKEWDKYRDFYSDVIDVYNSDYKDGMFFIRINPELPLSKNNFGFSETKNIKRYWDNKIEYDGKSMTIKEWAKELNCDPYSIMRRYYKRHRYTTAQILFGYFKAKPKNSPEKENRLRISRLLSQYKVKDKKKGLDFDLDVNWAVEIAKSCTYCGDETKMGFDRINNSIGHIKSNVVPCCYDCNVARSDNFTHEEMKEIGKAIKSVKDKRD